MQIKNVSPYGDLEVPLLRMVFLAGETVAVTEDQARRLLPQVGNYEPADAEARAVLAEITAPPAEDHVAEAPATPPDEDSAGTATAVTNEEDGER